MAGGMMLLKAGSHTIGVDFTVPVIILIVLLSLLSTFFASALFSPVDEEYTRPKAVVMRHCPAAPHEVPASFCIKLFFVESLGRRFAACLLLVEERSSFTSR